MNHLYVLSGPPRVGKTTVMHRLVQQTGVQLIAADALEHGLRNVLTGESHQLLRGIKLQGSAEYKTSIAEIGGWRSFAKEGTESELLLEFMLGALDYYRRNKESIALEGTEFAPAWVASLDMPDFTLKAAYLGYTDAAHIKHILAHAQNNQHDWINEWLEQDKGDDTNIRAWAERQAIRCQQLKRDAEKHGYPFFDISAMPFEQYTNAVLRYLQAD